MESTTSGSASASAASARNRSIRLRLNSRLREPTMSATSTFAASTCGSARSSPAARAIPPWRGSSAWTVPVAGSAATQSPTDGRSAAVAASWVMRPDGRPVSAPSAVTRSSRPRWTAATRAGIRSGRPSAARAASRRGVQPRAVRPPGKCDDNGGSPVRERVRARRAARVGDGLEGPAAGAQGGGGTGCRAPAQVSGRSCEPRARRGWRDVRCAEAFARQGSGDAGRMSRRLSVPCAQLLPACGASRAASGSQRPSSPTVPWTGFSAAGSPSRA